MSIDTISNVLLIILGAISLGLFLSVALILKTFLEESFFKQDQDYDRYYQTLE